MLGASTIANAVGYYEATKSDKKREEEAASAAAAAAPSSAKGVDAADEKERIAR